MIRSGRTWGRLRHDLTGTPEYSQSTNVRGTIGVSLSSVFLVCCSFVIAFAFSACTATRPVVKIGLLAPFEGLHRERGYEALAAMRAALAEQPLSDVEVLPLALDTSADPSQARRAAAKLLRDESVVAVVGPLRLQQVAAVADLIAVADVIWRLPTAPSSAEKLQMLVTAFLTQIDGKNILLAGQNSGWPQLSADEWSARSGKDVTIGDEVGTDASVDAILWLGDAPTGAAFLTRLRSENRTVPFWTTSIGGDPVFAALLLEKLDGAALGPVYWGIALDGSVSAGQFREWAATHEPSTPTAYAVFRATQAALEQVGGNKARSDTQALAIFTLERTGSSELAEIVPFP